MLKWFAVARITNPNGSWDEELEVEAAKSAEQDVRDIVNNFNRTLKPGEDPKVVESILKVYSKDVQKEEPEDEDPEGSWEGEEY